MRYDNYITNGNENRYMYTCCNFKYVSKCVFKYVFKYVYSWSKVYILMIWQTKSIPGQVNLSQIGGLNYWFIHPYKKLSQIGGLFSWVIRPYKKLSQIGGLFSWDLFIWMNKPVI